MNSKEGNLLSFKILVDETGTIVTELSGVPIDKLDKIFKGEDLILIKKIITDGRSKVEGIHKFLERELQLLK